jgi:hypothetical protein
MHPGTFNLFDFLLLIDLGQMMLLPGVVCSPLQLQPVTSAQTERRTYAIDRKQQWSGGHVCIPIHLPTCDIISTFPFRVG